MNTKFSDLLKGGLACGFFIFIGSSLQQVGLIYTTASKAAFRNVLIYINCPSSCPYNNEK